MMDTQRNAALDAAKGISLLSLPLIHSALVYARPEVQATRTGKVLGFIAEKLGANVFLTAMGISIALGKEKQPGVLVKRTVKLFAQAYLLNMLKFVLPGIMGILPEKMLQDLGMVKGKKALVELFKTGDILQLAAIANLVCGLMRGKKHYQVIALAAAILIVFGSPIAWEKQPLSGRLLTGQPPAAYFPVFPWLAYPLFGLSVGGLIKENNNKGYFLLGGASLLLIASSVLYGQEHKPQEDFYRSRPAGILLHLGAAGLFISLCSILRPGKFLSLLSKNVTVSYMIQWMLVCCMLPFFGYHKLNTRKTCFTGVLHTLLTIRLTRFLQKRNHKGGSI